MKDTGYAKFGDVGGVWAANKVHCGKCASGKFIGTKENVCIIKEFNSNMAAVSLFWDTNMAAVKSCESTLFRM